MQDIFQDFIEMIRFQDKYTLLIKNYFYIKLRRRTAMKLEEPARLKKELELLDVSLWPNYFSLEENLKIREQTILMKIIETKKTFFEKNVGLRQKIDMYLAPSRDLYYEPKNKECSYNLAGFHYSKPDDAVAIGLYIDPQILESNQFCIMYHGTKVHHLHSILKEGLKPGGGQAHKGTLDPYGKVVPLGVYFSFWMNQSFGYTIQDNPVILECYCRAENMNIAPGLKGYAVCTQSYISRILIPSKKIRTEQNF